MTSVARARYRLQVAWDAWNVGLLTFDRSTFDGVDVFGSSPLDATFGGTYDDVSSRLNRAQWGRGRDDNLASMLAGDALFELRDPGWTDGGGWHPGLYNPENSASPIYSGLADRLHPVRWEAVYGGVSYPLFVGWGRRFIWEPRGRRGIVQIECVDAFYWLDRVKPIIASTGATTTGAVIGLILDAAGLTDASMRDLDVGDSIPDFVAAGEATGLELIAALLSAERGVFFVARTGKMTYRSRLARLLKTSVWTLADRMIDVNPALDFDAARTRVTVQRTDLAGNVLYTATAMSSSPIVGRIGYVDLDPIVTPYLASNSQADQLASWILSIVQSPRSPIYDFTIDNRESDLLTQALTRELVDRITATEAAAGSTGDYHIDNVRHTYDGGAADGRHTVAWLLSRASTAPPLLFDSSTFDGGGVFVY